MVILTIACSCSNKSIPVSSGCSEFCEQIPEPTARMFKENLHNDDFIFLIELHNLKHCGCLTDQNEMLACQSKYEVKK